MSAPIGQLHVDLCSSFRCVWRVRDEQDRIVATCEQVGRFPVTADRYARLFAAAPDLLAALQRIVLNPDARVGGDMRAEAIAAIAKAEGTV